MFEKCAFFAFVTQMCYAFEAAEAVGEKIAASPAKLVGKITERPQKLVGKITAKAYFLFKTTILAHRTSAKMSRREIENALIEWKNNAEHQLSAP